MEKGNEEQQGFRIRKAGQKIGQKVKKKTNRSEWLYYTGSACNRKYLTNKLLFQPMDLSGRNRKLSSVTTKKGAKPLFSKQKN